MKPGPSTGRLKLARDAIRNHRLEGQIELSEIVTLFAETLGSLDSERPTGRDLRFKPGIGPLTENEVTDLLVARLRRERPNEFGRAGARGYPGSRAECDLVIPTQWAIEIKLARPF